jgi:hypothetical protein
MYWWKCEGTSIQWPMMPMLEYKTGHAADELPAKSNGHGESIFDHLTDYHLHHWVRILGNDTAPSI